MKRLTLAAVSATAIAAFSLPLIAVAQPHGHHGGMKAHLTEFDTNGDGDISKAEIDAKRAATFADADTNADGALSQAELVAHHEAKQAERKAKRQAAMFAKLDADGNGTISADEFNSRPMRGFDKMDTDGDGVITEEEREAMKTKWKEHRGKWRDRGVETTE